MAEEFPPGVEAVHVSGPNGEGGLYNLIVPGGFKRARLLLPFIDINPEAASVFRLRDAWVERDADGGIFIRVYTRIGGGYREDYAGAITALRGIEWYVRDADDTFDTTYASFWFRCPPPLVNDLTPIAVDTIDTDARWQAFQM